MSQLIVESTIFTSGELQKINITLAVVNKEHWSYSTYGRMELHGRFGFNAFNCMSCGCVG